jgi:hypothetical protein
MVPMHPNEHVLPSTVASLWTDMPKPWCAPHVNMPQPLWCASSLGSFYPILCLILVQAPWRIHIPKVPTFQTSVTLGCRATPSFVSLRNWARVSMPFYSNTLHPPPPQFIVFPDNIHKICNLQVSSRTPTPIATKSGRNPKFRAN